MVEFDVLKGDITAVEVDAIVNAANSSLMGGGGVDGAIHKAGGPSILAECEVIRREQYPHGLLTGEAVSTTAGNLPSKWVIHTVGPVYGHPGAPDLLRKCHESSLSVAESIGARSIAFPAISTGVYGYPVEEAAPIAVHSVLATPSGVERILFVLFDDHTYGVFAEALEQAVRD